MSNKAEKQFCSLEKKIRERVEALFKVLEQSPVPRAFHYDLSKIEGRDDSYRIRLSSFRVVYHIFWSEHVVRVETIERKSETTYG